MTVDDAIYFIQVGEDGPVKIGISSNPVSRLNQLQASHYERLRLLGTIPGTRVDERELHEKFANLCLGREWYPPEPAVMAEVERCAPSGDSIAPRAEIAVLDALICALRLAKAQIEKEIVQ